MRRRFALYVIMVLLLALGACAEKREEKIDGIYKGSVFVAGYMMNYLSSQPARCHVLVLIDGIEKVYTFSYQSAEVAWLKLKNCPNGTPVTVIMVGDKFRGLEWSRGDYYDGKR